MTYKVSIFIAALLCALFFFSCKSDSLKRTRRETVGNLTLDSAGQLKIDIDSITPNTTFVLNDYFQLGDTGFVAITDQSNSNLNIYNLNSRKLSKRIHFEEEGPNGIGKLYVAQYINQDSILVKGKKIHELYLTDDSGHIKQTYKANLRGLDNTRWTHFTFNGKPLLDNGMIFFTLTARVDNTERKYILTDLPFSKYDLQTGKAEMIRQIHFPNVLKDNKENWFTFDFDPAVAAFVDKFAYTFPVSDSIYVYEPKSGNVTAHGIPDVEGYKIPYPDQELSEKTIFKRMGEGFFNYQLLYDRFRNVFYRFVFLPYQGKKKYSDFYFYLAAKPITIQIIDAKDFTLKGEKKLPGERYYFRDAFVAPDGLYLSDNNQGNPENKESQLSYTRFKLSK